MPSRVLLHCLKSPIFHCSFILLPKIWRVFLISSAKSGNFHFLTSSPSSVALPKSSTFSFFFLLALFCSRRGDYLSNNLITNFHISPGYNFQIIFAFILRITQPFLPTCFYWLLKAWPFENKLTICWYLRKNTLWASISFKLIPSPKFMAEWKYVLLRKCCNLSPVTSCIGWTIWQYLFSSLHLGRYIILWC